MRKIIHYLLAFMLAISLGSMGNVVHAKADTSNDFYEYYLRDDGTYRVGLSDGFKAELDKAQNGTFTGKDAEECEYHWKTGDPLPNPAPNGMYNGRKVTSMYEMFYICQFVTSLNLSDFNTSNVTDMSYMFYYCSHLTLLDLSGFNTSKVTNMSNMFEDCYNLTSINLSSFNTSSVTDMHYMFSDCNSVTSLDLSNFDTSNVIDMHEMFGYCHKLTSINLSSFNTSNVTDMDCMFVACVSIKAIDLSNFNTSNVSDMHAMFCYCSSLTSLDLSSFNVSNVKDFYEMFAGTCSNTTSMVTGYAKDQSAADKFNNRNILNKTKIDLTKLKFVVKGAEKPTRVDISETKINLIGGQSQLLNVSVEPNDESIDKSIKWTSSDENVATVTNGLVTGVSKGTATITATSNADGNIKDECTVNILSNDGFDLKKDGYSVCNSYNSFKYDNVFKNIFGIEYYKIPLERYQEVFGKSYTKHIYKQNVKGWGGNCFGMSTTAALFYKNKLDLSKYVGSKTLNEGGYVDDGSLSTYYHRLNKDSYLTKLIERYQIWQDSTDDNDIEDSEMKNYETSEKRKIAFKNVIDDIKMNKEPYTLSVHWKNSDGQDNGHRMVVNSKTEPTDIGNGWYRIDIYDPNHPYCSYADNYYKNETHSIFEKKPESYYKDAENRYVEINITDGSWKMDVALNGDGSAKTVGDGDNGSTIRFINADKYPAYFDGKAPFISKGKDTTVIKYQSNSFKIFRKSDNTLIYEKKDGITKKLDEDCVISDYIPEETDESDNEISNGQIMLPYGTYQVSFDNGSIAFMENSDYAGVVTKNKALDVSNTDSTSLSISSSENANPNVVIMDSDSGSEDKYSSIETDVDIDNDETSVSLNDTKLNVKTKKTQNIDVDLITQDGEVSAKDISTDKITNLDIKEQSNSNTDQNNTSENNNQNNASEDNNTNNQNSSSTSGQASQSNDTKTNTDTKPAAPVNTPAASNQTDQTSQATTDTKSATPSQPTQTLKAKNKQADAIKAITASMTKSDKDLKGSVYSLLQLKASKATKNSVTIKWKKVSKASKYLVYGAKKGSKYKLLKTTSSKSYTNKKLKKGTYYKYTVIAVDKNGKKLSTSKVVIVTTIGGKTNNPASVNLNKSKVSLKKKKTFTIKAKVNGKKLKTYRKVAYESSNTKIATVSRKGKITAKKKGKAMIYVYAQNGVSKTVKVTIK